MDEIILIGLKLKTFTEQDISDYCQINSINPDDITDLWLTGNKLTDISGIKLFKNLEALYLENNQITDISDLNNLNKLEILLISNNKITDISVLKDLHNIQNLSIENLELESDQIKYIKLLNNLEELWSENGFKDMSVLNQLNKNIKIYE